VATAVIETGPDGVFIDVRVIPRARRSAIAGARDGALLVRLTAPPLEGAANAELVRLIADLLDVPKRAVTVVSGEPQNVNSALNFTIRAVRIVCGCSHTALFGTNVLL
jgi:uncharacterized protein (TIGR00251 family)